MTDQGKKHHHFCLQCWIAIPFVIQVVGTVSLVGYLSYQSGNQAVEEIVSKLLRQTSERIGDRLDNYLKTSQQVVATHSLSAKLGFLDVNNQEQLRQQIWQQMQLNPSLEANSFWGENGQSIGYIRVASEEFQKVAEKATGRSVPLGSTFLLKATPQQRQYFAVDADGNPAQLVLQLQDSFRDSPWYLQSKTISKQSWTSVFLSELLPLLQIVAIAPIYNQQGKLEGIFTSHYLLSSVSLFLNQLQFASNEKIFIIDESGDLVATSVNPEISGAIYQNGGLNRVNSLSSQDTVTRKVSQSLVKKFGDFKSVNENSESFQLNLTVEGERQFVQVRPYQDQYGLKWQVVTAIPESNLAAQIRDNTYRTIALCIFALFCSIGLSVWISRRIARSLSHLTKALSSFAETRNVPELASSKITEVNILTESLLQMMNEVSEADQLQLNYAEELEHQVNQKTLALSDILNSAIASISRLIVSQDRSWSVDYISNGCEDICGYSASEIKANPSLWFDCINPQDWQLIEAQVYDDIFAERKNTYTYRLNDKDGFQHWISQSNFSRWDAEQNSWSVTIIATDITAQKEIELALVSKETQFRELAAASPSVIYTVIEDGNGPIRFDFASPVFEELHEIPIAEAYQDASGIFNQMHPDDVEGYLKAVAYSKETMQPFRHEWRIITPSGKTKWLSASSRPLRRENGELIWHGVASDISDRKQLELQLVDSERANRAILNAIPDLLLRVDRNGFCLQFILPSDDLANKFVPIKMHLSEVLSPELLENELRYIDLALATGKLQAWEHQIIKYGKTCYEEVRLFPLNDDECLVVVTDISERKRLEQELIQSRDIRELTFNESSDALFLVDLETVRTVDCNRQAVNLFEAESKEELIDIEGHTLQKRQFTEQELAHIEQEIDQKGAWSMEVEYISRKGREFWGDLSAKRITFGNASFNLVRVVDITVRKQTELNLAKAKSAAEEATLVKSSFLATMSHEIRTPMNGVIGMTQLLEMTQLSVEQLELVKTIRDSGESLLSIINDVLDFSKIESGMVVIASKEFNLVEVIRGVSRILEKQVNEKQITLQYMIESDIPTNVVGDRDRLRQVLLNLVGNAVKFTHEGQVSISVSGKSLLFQNAASPKYQLNFKISDTGIGIQSDRLDRLFRPFSQVDSSISREYGGTGLGLEISKRIVEMMGGTIWVESDGQVGGKPPLDWESPMDSSLEQASVQGSTFYFTVIVTINQQETNLLKDPTLPTSINEKLAEQFPLRILIVEDNPVNQMLARLMLKRLGYESIEIANDGLEAIEVLEDNEYDLILMDMQMPKMDGLTATRIIRETLKKQTKIVAMTANTTLEDRQACLNAGMNDYISKPFKIQEIINLVLPQS
ncbi:MAG: hypothetical protein DCE90_17390 [Pseudanabaena sp.]|nr:MAG: hypothetical protein DCE90_17390 [Pseudanabaena sp.]